MTITKAIIVMGVSGCGKSTVGQLLANRLGWQFYDGDDFHPQANIDKMSQNIPLTDTDRLPWLQTLHDLIAKQVAKGDSLVVACSALKQRYRDILLTNNPDTVLVYLRGDYELIWHRMQARQEHFMKENMLRSQFKTLEEPISALIVDISLDASVIVENIISQIR